MQCHVILNFGIIGCICNILSYGSMQTDGHPTFWNRIVWGNHQSSDHVSVTKMHSILSPQTATFFVHVMIVQLKCQCKIL